MRFAWKTYMPNSLYGRAALILLVPMVTLLLVVSVVFIQRHYEGVTKQMTQNVARELRFILTLIQAAPTQAQALTDANEVAQPLAFQLALPAQEPADNALSPLDFSGAQMRETLGAEVPELLRYDLTRNRQVWVWITTRHGTLEVMFDRRRVSASNPHQLLVLMVLTGVFMTLIAFIFLRNQLRPIRRLARASEAFGKGQHRHYAPAGATEVRAAGAAFLDMRERIERQIEQRTMMLSGISHDLRTPLTRLRLGLSMLDTGAEDEAQDLLRDVSDMERLIEAFLAFARTDALDDPQDLDPAELVQGIVGRFHDMGDPVVLVEITGTGRAMLRPIAVERALNNLIGNAIRYATNCWVSLDIGAQTLRILVEDDGPGIPEDRRADALKPFARLDESRNQNKGGGVGLGLAIAHDIARRHGGALRLDQSDQGGLQAVLTLAR